MKAKIQKRKAQLHYITAGLILAFLVLPSFLALMIFLLTALVADLAYRPRSRILSSILLPIVSSGFAFILNLMNIDSISKRLLLSTLAALVLLLYLNNRIYSAEHQDQKLKLASYFRFSILPLGIVSISFINDANSFLNRFMGGDSRNVSLLVKNIFENGYISPEQQSNYPSNYLFISAVVVESLEGSATIIRYVMSLFVIFIFCTLLILIPLGRFSEYLKLGLFQKAILSLFVLTPPILGFILVNGFWTALWGIVLLIGFFTNLYIFFAENTIPPRSFLLIYILISYHAWALLPPLLLIIAIYCEYRRVLSQGWSVNMRELIAPLTLLSYTGLSMQTHKSFNNSPLDIVIMDGGIQSLPIFFLLLLFLISLLLLQGKSEFKIISVLVLFFLVASFSAIGLLRAPNSFAGYYNIKLFWIVYFSFTPILLALFLNKITRKDVLFPKLYVFFVFVFFASTSGLSLTTSASILSKHGGLRSEVIQILGEMKEGTPAIFWQFDDPPRDRIGSFWSSFLSNSANDQINFNQIAAWAYTQTGREEDLCNIVKLEPSLLIITRYPDAIKEVLSRVCPVESLNVTIR